MFSSYLVAQVWTCLTEHSNIHWCVCVWKRVRVQVAPKMAPSAGGSFWQLALTVGYHRRLCVLGTCGHTVHIVPEQASLGDLVTLSVAQQQLRQAHQMAC